MSYGVHLKYKDLKVCLKVAMQGRARSNVTPGAFPRIVIQKWGAVSRR